MNKKNKKEDSDKFSGELESLEKVLSNYKTYYPLILFRLIADSGT